MKTITLLLLALALVNTKSSFSQAPSWVWAKSQGGDHDEHALCVTTDGAGNSYAAGFFQSLSVAFGSDTLNNPGYYSYEMFLVKYDASGNILWAKRAGGTADEKALSIAADASGNIYVVGYYSSDEAAFGSITLTNSASGFADMFIAKYDDSGNELWVKSAWGLSQDYANGVAIDPSGNVCVTGYTYSSSMDFGGASVTNAGEWDIFIVKYNSGGTVLWAKSEGGTWIDDAQSIATDGDGNIYIAGWYSSSSITIGSTTLTNTNCCSLDILLAKYDSDGNALWAQSASGSWHDQIQSVAVDSSGNSYVAGYFISPSITFGPTTITNAGDYDLFIAKYDADGNLDWAQGAASGGAREQAQSIITDGLGNVYMTGWFASSFITFGSTTLTNNTIGLDEIFLVKYDQNGNPLWAKSVGSTSHDQSQGVTADASGNVWISGGYASSSIAFDTITVINASNDFDMFLAKIGDTTSYPPVSAFSTPDTTICEKFCIDFTDQSLNNPVSWLWTFEGASPSTSTDQNPTNICYDDPGVFDVTLVTTNADGLSDTLTLNNYITVNPNPFAPTIVQNGNTLTSSIATTYQWYFNGDIIPGATDQSYDITQSGLYTVIVGNENGCKAQATVDAVFTGINELSDAFDVNISSNPAADQLTIVASGNGSVEFEIINVMGQKLMNKAELLTAQRKIYPVDLTEIPSGIYFLIARAETGSKTFRCLKQ